MADFTEEIRARLERLLGDGVASVAGVSGGYTAAGRWRVTLASGSIVFVKLGTTEHTREALRHERRAYEVLRGPFMPALIAWEDDPLHPLLVIEDLGAAYWPPPWKPELVDRVRATLDLVHATQAELETFDQRYSGLYDGWLEVSKDPEPLRALGLATPDWLERALPRLIEASANVRTDGQQVIHLDVRSDNICIATRGVVLVDWNWACLGSVALDTGFWLPSLEAEGGPAPEAVLPGRPDIAAFVSGFFACRAGLPVIPDAPHVRRLQRKQLVPALRWAARELRLPPSTEA